MPVFSVLVQVLPEQVKYQLIPYKEMVEYAIFLFGNFL